MLTDIIHAIILGVIQGLTEFLPVSSSAHLNLFPWVFGWEEISDSFDVALHIGTLAAIIMFFFRDWLDLFKGGFNKVFKKEESLEGDMFWYIVIATIPAGIVSLILDKVSDMLIGGNIDLEMLIIAITLIALGIILYLVDMKCTSQYGYEDMLLRDAIIIGMSQGLAAAFPGVSRSGITMTFGRLLGYDRQSAAKFSFLLATPITLAAVVFDIGDFSFTPAFFVGILVSFVVGVLVINFLMQYLEKGSFAVFAIYRIIVGAAVIGVFLAKTGIFAK